MATNQMEKKRKMETKKTPEQEFAEYFKKMYEICNKNGWGDPFSYARGKEIYMANYLGHKVAPKLAGADGYEDKEMTIPVEYKSTTTKTIKATYNGISVQPTWEKQLQYLNEEKICKYKNHYFARFDNKGNIVELYKMKCEKVIEYLLPRIKIQFDKEEKGVDPRIGVSIGKTYILKNSDKLL